MAKGTKTGGRIKGTPNHATAAKAQAIAASGLTPLDFMLEVMRDQARDPKDRLEAAKAAAPFVHPKLASVELKGDEDNPLRSITEIRRIIVSADRANMKSPNREIETAR